MENLTKKDIITINGPVGSGKENLAKMYATYFPNSKTVKMPLRSTIELHQILRTNDSEGYGAFITNQCLRIISEISDYLKVGNKKKLLIIITDVSSLANVLAKDSAAPKISDDVQKNLNQIEERYWALLQKKEVNLTYIVTNNKPKRVLFNTCQKKDKPQQTIFTCDKLEEQIDAYCILIDKLKIENGLTTENKDNFPTKLSAVTLFGHNSSFQTYHYR